jgi:hypothetical protein
MKSMDNENGGAMASAACEENILQQLEKPSGQISRNWRKRIAPHRKKAWRSILIWQPAENEKWQAGWRVGDWWWRYLLCYRATTALYQQIWRRSTQNDLYASFYSFAAAL